jgi:hypothetical protein
MTPQEILQRCVWAGAMTRNADALAGLFAADGVLEAPLVPLGHDYPRRVEGREQIRAAMAAYYQRSANLGQTVDTGKSGYLLYTHLRPRRVHCRDRHCSRWACRDHDDLAC